MVVVFCLYAAMTPKSILDSTRRAFLADVVRPTNTRLIHIKPGDDPELAQVVAGSHVEFTVDSTGTRPEKIFLHYSVDHGKFFAKQEIAPGVNYYDAWQRTLRNVQQSIDYYLTGGDAESLRYHLEVLPAPMVTSIRLDFQFPGYIKLPPRLNIEGGNIEAIEGTLVTVHARTNQARAVAAGSSCPRPGTKRPTWRSRPPTRTRLTGRVQCSSDRARTRSSSDHRQAGSTPTRWSTTSSPCPTSPRRRSSSAPTSRLFKVPSNVKVSLSS